ncbi:MAG: hypothetical protein HFJ10_13195 [Lachnospiraceae bacterium]|nr:hypothetical protein [Lachnospiraceae bacterium]
MEKLISLESAIETFNNGEYADAAQDLKFLLEQEPDNFRIRLYYLVSLGLSASPVKGEDLTKVWNQAESLLRQTEEYNLMEEARHLLSIYANAVYIRCNDWQKMEYALLQKDVSFEKKELVLKEFQRILLEADVEYRAVLNVLYGYAALCAERASKPGTPSAFLEGALKTMTEAAQLQGEIGLEEDFAPLNLALFACRLHLEENMAEAWEMRRNLLDLCLHGEKALSQWETFAPYAHAGKQKELEAEVKKIRRREKFKVWKRPDKKQH